MNYHYQQQNPNRGMGLLPPPVPQFSSQMQVNPAPPVDNLGFIGPVVPENTHVNEDMNIEDDNDCSIVNSEGGDNNQGSNNAGSRGRDRGNDRNEKRDRDRDRDRGRNRRSRDRYSRDQNDRNQGDRDRNNRGDRNDRGPREKRTKWDNNDNRGNTNFTGAGNSPMPNMMMPGTMMQYNNMGNMMGQQPIDMNSMATMPNMPGAAMPNMPGNMPNMAGNIPNMPGNIPNMPGAMPNMPGGMPNVPAMANMPPNMAVGNMMPGMNMMQMGGNMMDPNMMMMNQPMMQMANQPLYINEAVLLPPLPGVSMPPQRERPPGCRTIFVGGLPVGVTREVIQEIFQNFGTISDMKVHKQGSCHVRFEKQESVEQSFYVSGYRFKMHDQTENEATTLFVDYALNREDQAEFERNKRLREPTPSRVEPFTAAALVSVTDKIKTDDQFSEVAPTLAFWLERGECNKKNAGTFYSLIQTSNNQLRRLFNEKMSLDEEYQTFKSTMREKFGKVVLQFEQVAKILKAARAQRVSDHFTKQQRRNIEMWLKMTEEVENLKEEFNAMFEDDDEVRPGRNAVPLEKYEELRTENEKLNYELEGYKNEAHLAKDEAERKFEKFKAHFIAQQALQGKQQVYPPLPPQPPPNMAAVPPTPQNPPLPPEDNKATLSGPSVSPTEAKLISVLTAFLLAHPLGANVDYLVSYVRTMLPNATRVTVNQVLQKYTDVFRKKSSGIGATMDIRWEFVAFDNIKRAT